MAIDYIIKFSKKAEKFIKAQNRYTRERIINSITELPKGDVKKLKGMDGVYRLRVLEFRILFEKNDRELVIIIIDIGNRGQIYKQI